MEIAVVTNNKSGKKRHPGTLDVCIEINDLNANNPFEDYSSIITKIQEHISQKGYELRIRISKEIQEKFAEGVLLNFLAKIRNFFSEKSNQASFA
jgi:hypothetical protein